MKLPVSVVRDFDDIQRNFETVEGAISEAVVNHTGSRPMEVLGVYSVAFSLAAGAFASTNVTVPDLTGRSFIPVGAVFYTGTVSSQDQVTWAYSWPAATTVQITLHNHSAGAAAGTFYFWLLAAG